MRYGSSSDPVVSLQFHLVDRAEEFNDQEADYIRADVQVGSSTGQSYWAAGNNDPYQGTNGDDYDALLSVQINANDIDTGVYKWKVTEGIYNSSDPENSIVLPYSEDQQTTGYFVHVVNRTDSPFGDGWSLPGLDELIIQSGSAAQPAGVALLTGDDELIWFGTPTDGDNGTTTYTREVNPYNFSELRKLTAGTYTLTDPDGTVHNFDSTGLLTSVVDRNGNVLRGYTYDNDRRLTLITELPDLSGPITKFDYNNNGLISAITDFCQWTLDEYNEPLLTTTTGSQVTQFHYSLDMSQMIMTAPDPDGPSGALTSPVTTYNYNSAGKLVSVIDPRGLETDVEYDNVGLVKKITERCGGVITIKTQEALAAGSPTDTGNDLPRMIQFRFPESMANATADQEGYEIQTIYGNPTIVVRGEFGNIITQKDAAGNVTQFDYNDSNARGLLHEVTQANPNNASQPLTTTYLYDPDGLVAHVSYPIGSAESWARDPLFAQVTSYTDANLHNTTYEVDSNNGNVQSMTQNDGSVNLITYFTYTDANDNTLLGMVERIIDPNDNITHRHYNARGLVETIVYAEDRPDEVTVQYEYDDRDRLHFLTDGRGNRTEYLYDNLDRLLQRVDPDPDGDGPLDNPVWQYFYDPNGNLTHVVDPRENVTQYVYDVRDRPFQVLEPVADPTVTAAIIYKDDDEASVSGNWLETLQDGAYGDYVRTTSTIGASATFSFTTAQDGLDPTKKYAVQVRWLPSESTTYDAAAEWRVDGESITTNPLTTLHVDLNRSPEDLPDDEGRMWVTLGAFSPVNGALTVQLADTNNPNNSGHLVVDAVRLVEVGPVTETDYDCNGNLRKTIDPLNHVTSYEYDNLNRLTLRTDPDPDAPGIGAESALTNYTYNSLGWLTSMTDPNENVTLYQYNNMGWQTKEIKVAEEPGLTGEYRNADGTLLYSRIDASVNFDTSTYFAGDENLPDGFVASWTGAILIDDPDTVTFYVKTTDWGDLYIDGKLVVDNFALSGMPEEQGNITLTAGWHALQIVFKDIHSGDGSGLIVSYNVGGDKVPIPRDVLSTTQVTTTTYDDAGLVTHVTDALNRGTHYTYDGVDRLSGAASEIYRGPYHNTYYDAGPVTDYSYDLNVVTATNLLDEGNESTVYTYDGLHRLSKLEDPSHGVTTYTYDDAGNRKSVTNAEGNVTFYQYDGLDRQTKVTKAAFDPGLWGEYFDADHNSLHGRVDETINFDASADFAGYDDLPDGFSATWTSAIYIDEPSVVTFHITSTDDSEVFVDDVSVIGGSGTPGMHESSGDSATLAAGWHTLRITFTDRYNDEEDILSGIIVSYEGHDGNLVLTSQNELDGSASSATYDELGNRKSLTDPNGNITTWDYDNLNRMTAESIVISYNTLSRHYDYDAAGNIIQKTDRNGRVITYDYDNLNRRKAENWLDGEDILKTISYDYDALGNLLTVSDEDAATYDYLYDHLNRQTSITQTIAGLEQQIHFDHTYDLAGEMISSAATIGSSLDYLNNYIYDDVGRLSTLTQHEQDGGNAVSAKSVGFGYDDANRLTSLERYASTTTDNPVATSEYGYMSGRLTSIDHVATALDATFTETHSYSYDQASRVTEYTDTFDGIYTGYHYDDFGRLDDDWVQDWYDHYIYTYDANGNVIDDGQAHDMGAYNRLDSDGTYSYEYDNEGNLVFRSETNDPGTRIYYTWDYRNRLTHISGLDGDHEVLVVDYAYDAFNQLVNRRTDKPFVVSESSTVFVHDNGQVVLQFDTDGAGTAGLSDLSHRYLWGAAVDQLLADEQVHGLVTAVDNETLWALADRQGSVRQLVDSNGVLRKNMTYSAWGDIRYETWYDADGQLIEGADPSTDENAVDQVFYYTGRLFDKFTGLQNNLNRWYDPSTGRWISEDPSPGALDIDVNLYRYVGNSPTNNTDSTGMATVGVGAGIGVYPIVGKVGYSADLNVRFWWVIPTDFQLLAPKRPDLEQPWAAAAMLTALGLMRKTYHN